MREQRFFGVAHDGNEMRRPLARLVAIIALGMVPNSGAMSGTTAFLPQSSYRPGAVDARRSEASSGEAAYRELPVATKSTANVTAVNDIQMRYPMLFSLIQGTRNDDNLQTMAPPPPTTLDATYPVLASRVVTLLAVVGCSTLLTQALCAWEWMQTWRYCWPLALGGWYAYQGWMQHTQSANQLDTTAAAAYWPMDETAVPRWIPWSMIVAGIGLVVGGAADALLPAYVTGPNLFTAAGLGPDSAAYLFVVTLLWGPSTNSSRRPPSQNIFKQSTTISRVLLLSQLYILGAGSFDDVVSQSQQILVGLS